jgi:outer membrane receptor protein involved in Fe transport
MLRFAHIILIFILLLTGFESFGQARIKGQVLSDKKEPIEYANLRVFKADSTVLAGGYSDEKGMIEIEKIPFGSYYAIVTAFGFTDYIIPRIQLDIKTIKFDFGVITLKPEASLELDEVVITSEKKVLETSFDKRVYNLEEDLTTQGGSATDILSNIPSIEVDNQGNVSLRGNQNVTILIDGRPSAISGGVTGALEAIPAASIERIEIVTNPSAKYDPDGTAGIINIVLKKNKLRGINAGVDVSGATGPLVNGSANINYRTEKFNLFASYAYRRSYGYRNNFNDRYTFLSDTINLNQTRRGDDVDIAHTIKLGSDFFIKENQVIGISLSGSASDRTRRGDQINFEEINGDLQRTWNRVTVDPRIRYNLDINTDYKWDFKDKKGDLTAVLTQSIGENGGTSVFDEVYFDANGNLLPFELYQEQTGLMNTSMFTGSVDLTRNLNEKMRYETGVKTIFNRRFRSNYMEFLDSVSGEIIPDINVINDFQFDEDIYSAYGIFGHQPHDKFKYQVGLRLEQANTRPQLLTSNEDFENNYFSYFPSAHFIYEPKQKREYALSFSRRINRPNTWNLNPFPIYDDPLNLRQGNPALMPEYINSIEASHQRIYEKLTLSSSLYFRQTTDKIQRIREFYPDGVSINTFANIDESYDYGIELIGMYSPFKWWKNTISFNGYETRLAANINGIDLRNSGFSWNAKWNATFNLFKNTTTIQMNVQYYAPSFTVQGYFQRTGGVDLALNRVFFEKKLSVGVRVTDIFNTQGFLMEVTQGPTTQYSEYKWLTRRVFLTASYKFGRLDEAKQRRKNNTGSGGGGGDDF